MPKTHNCFFVTPIGASGSAERKRADDLLTHVLRPISKGFLDITRADEVDDPGTITTDIVNRLYNDALVIADLTGHNPNVMYEVGLRHCFNLPIVHIAQDGDKPPFDLAAERIIFFDINDLSSVEEGKKRIMAACKKVLESQNFRSPVVRALDKKTLFAADSAAPSSFDIESKLEDLEAKFEDMASAVVDDVFNAISNIQIDFSNNSFLENRIDELVRKFDFLGAPELEKLAQAAKILVSQSAPKKD